MSDINLDGGEITVIKSLGFSGSSKSGEELRSGLSEFDYAELVDTVQGLMMMGYVSCDRNSFNEEKEFDKAHFSVNTGYSKDLREAIDPKKHAKPQKSRRQRRE